MLSKFENTKKWLDPVKLYDPDFAEAIDHLHMAICFSDDVADRALSSSYSSMALWRAFSGVEYFIKNPEKWPLIQKVLERIYISEENNLKFIPNSRPIEEELIIWETRASLLDLYFQAWCIADNSFDTLENWEWFKDFKRLVLILDDCRDIEDGIFEDVIQCRRNYVVLKEFGFEGYIGFGKDKISSFQDASKKIRESIKIPEPKDNRMNAFRR